MANVKISNLTAATTPVAGTEVLPIVQSGATVKVSIANLTAGRAVSVLSLTSTNDSTISGLTVGKGAGAVATNTAVGYQALNNNTNTLNTAFGYRALTTNTSGQAVTAVGSDALRDNSTGSRNTAVGYGTLANNNTGENNSAVGQTALGSNTTGTNNSALGYDALSTNTSGAYNTAFGKDALNKNTTASYNTAVGYQAGYSITTGGAGAGLNTFMGTKAGYNATGYRNVFYGYQSGTLVTTGSSNTIIGNFEGNTGGLDIRTASNYIVLSDGDGNPRGVFDNSGNFLVGTTNAGGSKFRVNSAGLAGAFYVTAASTTATEAIQIVKYDNNSTTAQVFQKFYINDGAAACGQINANGANTAAFGSTSDSRLKENIVDLPSQLSNIMALRPVEFDYIESEGGGHQIGFVAQEMQAVYSDAVGERKDGMLMVTGWSKTEARLVKAIQEQQALITQLTSRITALESA